MIYLDPVVYDWAHIQAPTLVYGGAEDMLAGSLPPFKRGCSVLQGPFRMVRRGWNSFRALDTSRLSRPRTLDAAAACVPQ